MNSITGTWPVPAWQAPLDWESLLVAWNVASGTLLQLANADTNRNSIADRYHDSLLYWFVNANLGLQRERSVHSSIEDRPSWTRWEELGRELNSLNQWYDQDNKRDSRRVTVFDSWLKQLVTELRAGTLLLNQKHAEVFLGQLGSI